MAEWHCMQTEEGGMPSVSPGSGFAWHILHCSFRAPAWALWLNGKGWSGASAAVAARTAASTNRHDALQPLTDFMTVTISCRERLHRRLRGGGGGEAVRSGSGGAAGERSGPACTGSA